MKTQLKGDTCSLTSTYPCSFPVTVLCNLPFGCCASLTVSCSVSEIQCAESWGGYLPLMTCTEGVFCVCMPPAYYLGRKAWLQPCFWFYFFVCECSTPSDWWHWESFYCVFSKCLVENSGFKNEYDFLAFFESLKTCNIDYQISVSNSCGKQEDATRLYPTVFRTSVANTNLAIPRVALLVKIVLVVKSKAGSLL